MVQLRAGGLFKVEELQQDCSMQGFLGLTKFFSEGSGMKLKVQGVNLQSCEGWCKDAQALMSHPQMYRKTPSWEAWQKNATRKHGRRTLLSL